MVVKHEHDGLEPTCMHIQFQEEVGKTIEQDESKFN
jgi:hypothetical protein